VAHLVTALQAGRSRVRFPSRPLVACYRVIFTFLYTSRVYLRVATEGPLCRPHSPFC
jgi:hypothetical protein